MNRRSSELEILDNPDMPPEELLASLNFMRQVNQMLGGMRAVIDTFARWDLPSEFTVLDIGCGGGDIAFGLARWAASRGKHAKITAIDLNPLCLAYAEQNFSSPDIRHLQHSAFELESLGSFDYIISSMFFHHLKDDEIVALLSNIKKQAKRGFLVNDLYRGYLNYAGAWLLGVFSGRPVVFNDAKLSVARAFRQKDFEQYREQAQIPDARIECKPVFRILLSHGHD